MDEIKKINKHGVFFGFHLYRTPEAPVFYSSLRGAVKLLLKHGYTLNHAIVLGQPYIQLARNQLVSKFLESDSEIFFFVADDLEYKPEDMLKVIETPGDVVVGVYSKHETPANYPVRIYSNNDGRPKTRDDGCIQANQVQTGFMCIKRSVFEKIEAAYPKLSYYGRKDGRKVNCGFDFFPQGVHDHKWIGEDYAFCKLWRDIGGKIWIVPDLTLTHWEGEVGYKGNFHKYLTRRPGGINELVQDEWGGAPLWRKGSINSLVPLIKSLDCNNATMVEIGCFTGEATKFFSDSNIFDIIYCVDPWNDTELSPNETNYEDLGVAEKIFNKRISNLTTKIKKIKATSMKAVQTFRDETFDFIYIDACHEYSFVKEDIINWLPKLKSGGTIGGHDYGAFPGVKKAVDEIFGTVAHFPDTSWMIELEK